MKTGADYSASPERRAFDLAFSTLLMPATVAGKIVVRKLIANSTGKDLAPTVSEERIGYKHIPFEMKKFLVTDPDTNEHFGQWAETIDSKGIDELAQVENIHAGEMAVFGSRPLDLEYREMLMDLMSPRLGQKWDKVVDLQKPGVISPWSLYAHSTESVLPETEETAGMRGEMDIKFQMDHSFALELQLANQFMGLVLGLRKD